MAEDLAVKKPIPITKSNLAGEMRDYLHLLRRLSDGVEGICFPMSVLILCKS
jgi:hypothetical protein